MGYRKKEILNLQQLCAHETAKLCFKDHTQKLPVHFSESTMPTKTVEREQHYNLRNNIDRQYSYEMDEKYNLTFSHYCIKTWNNLPTQLKALAYSNTTYQHFNLQSKNYFLSKQS